MIKKVNRPRDLYKELKSYATASFVLYFLIMCLVICVIVSCACLTQESINASASAATYSASYDSSVVDTYLAGIAASCGVWIFNIIGIVKATQIPNDNPHRSPIFVMEVVTLVLSFFIGLLAWIPAAILLAMVNKAIKEQQQAPVIEQTNSQII